LVDFVLNVGRRRELDSRGAVTGFHLECLSTSQTFLIGSSLQVLPGISSALMVLIPMGKRLPAGFGPVMLAGAVSGVAGGSILLVHGELEKARRLIVAYSGWRG
jgi:hypothetical protein